MTDIPQVHQADWHYQWSRYREPSQDQTAFLFFNWIQPRIVEDFRNKNVFDAGCGPGHHIRLIAPVAKHVTGMDLNTSTIAQERLADLENVTILQGDIAAHHPATPYDVVYCVGVIHHTDDPDRTFKNLKRMCREGGLLIIWCYSHEGNKLVQYIVEPLRKWFLKHCNRRTIEWFSYLITVLVYPIIHTIYRLPLKMLPYYEYFQDFRKLSFERNMWNIFDKLNAPQTEFIPLEHVERWFDPEEFEDISITSYKGVSWRASGIVKSR
jgi:SAM-dependent methyltransferase